MLPPIKPIKRTTARLPPMSAGHVPATVDDFTMPGILPIAVQILANVHGIGKSAFAAIACVRKMPFETLEVNHVSCKVDGSSAEKRGMIAAFVVQHPFCIRQ
ncbi:MAG: hypothetical protein IKH04_03590 [Kiritimatiellae bacterium]|nr:hypothetical protein [Kiritimatiellia bacterium]